MKRENEIGASDTRKADEGGLVCRSAPLSHKLDTSPLPGRPRPVRRLDAVDDHGRKPWYAAKSAQDARIQSGIKRIALFLSKWVFRGSL